MTIQIQLEDTTADALRAIARANGLSLDEYLRRVANQSGIAEGHAVASAAEAARDFDAALDDLFAGDSRDLPPADSTYRRTDIYLDHD